MFFSVRTFQPGLMAYDMKLFIEEQGVLKMLEIPFKAVCKADPNNPSELGEETSADEKGTEATESQSGSQDPSSASPVEETSHGSSF